VRDVVAFALGIVGEAGFSSKENAWTPPPIDREDQAGRAPPTITTFARRHGFPANCAAARETYGGERALSTTRAKDCACMNTMRERRSSLCHASKRGGV